MSTLRLNLFECSRNVYLMVRIHIDVPSCVSILEKKLHLYNACVINIFMEFYRLSERKMVNIWCVYSTRNIFNGEYNRSTVYEVTEFRVDFFHTEACIILPDIMSEGRVSVFLKQRSQ